MIKLGSLLLFFIAVCSTNLSAQDYDWWADNVQWDGVTRWSQYIIYAPRYLGPNALPIPTLGNGRVDSVHYAMASANRHRGNGDKTNNLGTFAGFVIAKGKVSMDLYMVPVEYYTVSHETKTERKYFFLNYDDKQAKGDLFLNTVLQVMHKKWLDATFRIGYRFPSSNHVGAARFTDAPGYHFDFTFGKNLAQTPHFSLRANAMLGFLVWQTNQPDQHQDDAELYAVGLQSQFKNFSIITECRGYHGYLNNGDQPMVVRGSATYLLKKKIIFRYSWQKGLHDFPVTSSELGVGFVINKH